MRRLPSPTSLPGIVGGALLMTAFAAPLVLYGALLALDGAGVPTAWIGAAVFALVFALALTLSSSFTTRTVNSADIHEKCIDCQVRANRQQEHCMQQHPDDPALCGDNFNRDIVHCFRNFCEQ
jgi:hypothetical protein